MGLNCYFDGDWTNAKDILSKTLVNFDWLNYINLYMYR